MALGLAESKNIIVCLQQKACLLWRGWQTLLFLSFLRQGQFLLELRQWQRHFVWAAGIPSINPPVFGTGSEISVTMKKQYREVSYSDGTFAYYETGFFAQDLTMGGTYYGSPEAIFSGGLY